MVGTLGALTLPLGLVSDGGDRERGRLLVSWLPSTASAWRLSFLRLMITRF